MVAVADNNSVTCQLCHRDVQMSVCNPSNQPPIDQEYVDLNNRLVERMTMDVTQDTEQQRRDFIADMCRFQSHRSRMRIQDEQFLDDFERQLVEWKKYLDDMVETMKQEHVSND